MIKKFIEISTPRGKRRIGYGEPTFIVAEMSANHGQDFNKAKDIVKAAAAAGADAIKLQTYTPDSMTLNSREPWFVVNGPDHPKEWQDKTLYELYEKAQTPREWHQPLQAFANELGLTFFSTPFSNDDVDFLETLNVPLYKVASYEATDLHLLKKIAKTGKPVILSVGFASKDEISKSVSTLRENGCVDLALLYCVTSYTAIPNIAETNLITMLNLGEEFGVVYGFSDNNGGNEIPLLAGAMGASVIEKHIAIDNSALDAQFSLNENSFKDLVSGLRRQEAIKGVVHYGPQNNSEKDNSHFRRTLYAVKDINKGEIISDESIRSLRPAVGISAQYYDTVIGKIAKRSISKGTPLSFEMFE